MFFFNPFRQPMAVEQSPLLSLATQTTSASSNKLYKNCRSKPVYGPTSSLTRTMDNDCS